MGKFLAIIPARSGSKGITDKNIKMLGGKPLLAYTIESALNSGLFDEVMISTDSEKYAEIAKQWGAKAPFLRSIELSNDSASSLDVIKDVIEKYRLLGHKYDIVALLQPTSPLRTADDIISGYKVFTEKDANTVVAVCEMDHSPLWSNTLPEDFSMYNFIKPEVVNMPRQNIPKYYRINGALYIIKVDYLMKTQNIYDDKSFATIMSKENSIDIDDPLDFTVAEVLIKTRNDNHI